ncbi:HepT-like ribonuclease domain-containing protein [Roseomonas sp. F4]
MTRAPRDDAALLRDILKSAESALRFAEGLDEAAWRMTPGFKAAHPDVPWQAMAGMRHRIVHDYT